MLQQIISHPIQTLISLIITGIAVMIAAAIVPGFKVRGGFGSAVLVGLVYGVLKLFLKVPLLILAWPALLLGGLLAFFAANVFLLWLTDKILDDFELESTSALLLGTLVLSLLDVLVLGSALF